MIEAIRSRLDAASTRPGPKYQTLRDAIREAISSGEWPAGARLPTEVELSRLLPYSLGTVQKAYGELVRAGAVVRTRGRGSFVASSHREMPEPWHSRFLDEAGNVLPVYPRLVGHGPAPFQPRWTGLFGAGAAVTVIDRLLSIGDEFEVLSRFYVRDEIATALLGLPREDIESANFKVVLFRLLGTRIVRIRQTLQSADKESWRRFGMAGAPHLLLRATAWTAQPELAYFQELYVPRNRRRLLFESELKS